MLKDKEANKVIENRLHVEEVEGKGGNDNYEFIIKNNETPE